MLMLVMRARKVFSKYLPLCQKFRDGTKSRICGRKVLGLGSWACGINDS
jgi:hypothetical protein